VIGRIDPQLPEIGRIRLGYRAPSKQLGKIMPYRSDAFIFTSQSKGTLAALSKQVGGVVDEWPDGQEPWRLVSKVSSLPVRVPPYLVRPPVFELWSGAGLLRRCDGETCERPSETPSGPVLVSGPCTCEPGAMECKMTTRFVLMLPQAPGLGVWVCTTHSVIAGREILGQLRLLELAGPAGLVSATLAIEQENVQGRPPVPVVRLRFHQGLSELTGSEPAALDSARPSRPRSS
jgi:hypothetical protein